MASHKKTFVGIDIGGSKIEGILWRGKIINAIAIKTPQSRAAFLTRLTALIRRLMSGRGVKGITGIGIGCAGGIDVKSGKIIHGPNTKFLNNLDLAATLRKRFKTPVRIDNDTNCFLRAEFHFGAARNMNNVVGLTLGTGVGGALMLDGQVRHGAHISGFEFGHMIIASPSLTVEDLVSSHGFARLGVRHPLEAQQKAFAGDKKARRIYERIGRHLGIALANLVNIFDPELIVIGGGISRAGNLLLTPAKQEMKKHVVKSVKKLPPVKISKLNHAGAVGAVSLFLSK